MTLRRQQNPSRTLIMLAKFFEDSVMIHVFLHENGEFLLALH